MIRITTAHEDVFDVTEDEVGAYQEMLDADGVEYTIIDLSTPSVLEVPVNLHSLPEMGWVEERERQSSRPTKAQLAADYAAQCAKTQASESARRTAEAAATNVPEWVIKVREEIAIARRLGKSPDKYGQVCRRFDGSWYFFDDFGARRDLPSDAGTYFTNEQTAI